MKKIIIGSTLIGVALFMMGCKDLLSEPYKSTAIVFAPLLWIPALVLCCELWQKRISDYSIPLNLAVACYLMGFIGVICFPPLALFGFIKPFWIVWITVCGFAGGIIFTIADFVLLVVKKIVLWGFKKN